ncbi:hypothetical protein [Sphingomicrobium astaxanthinifaciens]|uniref:hypothetical protein n=1 Tax=Sphingomicrobium astaxanthinifaciens TaxID=1227949 RepID=UPI001FCB0ACD|nr:hypothetical protein [Sphingomicrobium astaxanthinifaciens]MCJ7420965.1 hypothetical protein [Sphingomicrobium astaxanthinifaciens]
MSVLAAFMFALAIPPLIALRWDARKLHRMRERAEAAGLDPARASHRAYLQRAWVSFPLTTIGIFVMIGLRRRFEMSEPEALVAALPFLLAAIVVQQRSTRGIERELFGER